MLNEETIINLIAAQERSISGVRNSYGFAQNPDSLVGGMLPAVLHYIPGFTSKPLAHHNVWDETITVRSIICVAPRQSQSGKLAYLENEAMPFMYKWRRKFQDRDVIVGLLGGTGARTCWLDSATYGAGGILLTVAAVEYIGIVASFTFKSA